MSVSCTGLNIGVDESSVQPLVRAVQVYGSYYRKLSKRVQTALAEANAVAEEVLSAMATVRLCTGVQYCTY